MTILIDDGQGARAATSEIRRLRRIRNAGGVVGSISLVSTLTVLERAAGSVHIPDKIAMRALYGQLRSLDDGIPPLETTRLLAPALWS